MCPVLCMCDTQYDASDLHVKETSMIFHSQVSTVLSRLPLLNVRWHVRLQSGAPVTPSPPYLLTAPKQRAWVKVPVGEECVVEECVVVVELERKCLRGKVREGWEGVHVGTIHSLLQPTLCEKVR